MSCRSVSTRIRQGGREVRNSSTVERTSFPCGYCIRRPPGHNAGCPENRGHVMTGRKKSAILTGADGRCAIQGVSTLHTNSIYPVGRSGQGIHLCRLPLNIIHKPTFSTGFSRVIGADVPDKFGGCAAVSADRNNRQRAHDVVHALFDGADWAGFIVHTITLATTMTLIQSGR